MAVHSTSESESSSLVRAIIADRDGTLAQDGSIDESIDILSPRWFEGEDRGPIAIL